MPSGEITTISLPLPLRMGLVHCYLVAADAGYVLIDTGHPGGRAHLERGLEAAGCERGNLRLIILTHGDFDHAGNCAALRQSFGAPVAMHPGDAGMVERGDMFWNRTRDNALIRRMAPLLFGFTRSRRFTPDLLVEDGYDLRQHGFDARVVCIPGHSKGSIGILTGEGDMFSGDLFVNVAGPALGSIMDNVAEARASVERLTSLGIRTVYPGHGRPFAMEDFLRGQR